MTDINQIAASLRQSLAGRVIVSGDAAYDAARLVFAGAIDKRPGIIARVANADDVAKVVSVARDNGLELAIRSGGHSANGHSTTDGGLVIDLRDMNKVEIDVAGRTAWVETGANAGEVTAALAPHGLAIGFGDTGSVGVGGITLGGGVGYLVRKLGLTIDALLAAEMVTADGKVVTADDKTDVELFWALRGGGGNFGVVTRFKFRLSELTAFTGGMICLPATAETVAGFIAAAQAAPEALSTIANVMSAPPMPFLPEAVHGKIVILGMLAFAGEPADAEKALALFRALATPYADFIKPGSYGDMFPPEDPSYRPTAVGETLFMQRVGLAEAKTIVDTLAASDASLRVAQLRVLGGAYARVANDATAYAHRAAPIMVNTAAFYTTPEDKKLRQAWVKEFSATLRAGDASGYVNFINHEGDDAVKSAYPAATYERLRAVKRQNDPKNLFRLNQNIKP